MPKVRIEPGGVEVEVDMGVSLLEAFDLALDKQPALLSWMDLWNDCECHGFVEVLSGEGHLRSYVPGELDALKGRGMPIGTAPVRHMCQTMVLGDVVVRLLRRGSNAPIR